MLPSVGLLRRGGRKPLDKPQDQCSGAPPGLGLGKIGEAADDVGDDVKLVVRDIFDRQKWHAMERAYLGDSRRFHVLAQRSIPAVEQVKSCRFEMESERAALSQA